MSELPSELCMTYLKTAQNTGEFVHYRQSTNRGEGGQIWAGRGQIWAGRGQIWAEGGLKVGRSGLKAVSPYGPHVFPGCRSHMGPIWAAHMGPISQPIWAPYGTHISLLAGMVLCTIFIP